MKGFRPTGYGPSAGFRFPARLGFSGSTGSVTNVAPYVRRKYATGGFVRQDKPRMKSESVGDSGSALVRRAKPTTQLDAESGGRTPLRPGFAFGGTSAKAVKAAMAKAQQQQGGQSPAVAVVPRGRGPLAQMIHTAIDRSRRSKPAPPAPDVRIPAIKGRFYADGGRANRQRKADGGEIRRDPGHAPRRVGGYTFSESLQAIPGALTEAFRATATKAGRASTGMAKKGAERVSGRQRQIDREVDQAVTGMTKYARGGKAKRMGYDEGGHVNAQRLLRTFKTMHDNPRDFAGKEQSDSSVRALAQYMADGRTSPNHRVNLKKTRTVKSSYAKGGGVSASEAKKIAERTVGDHVRYPVPRGHKGLKKSC